MSQNRLPDYLDHIQQAATDACSFVDGMTRDDFLNDKRTQQAVIMSLIVVGEAATKIMDGYPDFIQAYPGAKQHVVTLNTFNAAVARQWLASRVLPARR